MAGSWSGGGTIDLTNDIHERLRCRATHTYAQVSNSLSLSIRCASDNYKFELSSNVVERRGQLSGKWSETNYGVTGTISGRVVGNRVTAVATGDKFSADLSVTTNGNRQSVTITRRRPICKTSDRAQPGSAGSSFGHRKTIKFSRLSRCASHAGIELSAGSHHLVGNQRG